MGKGSEKFEHAPKLAAIDVGTNSIRLIVAQLKPDGGYRIIDDEKARTRLGAGLVDTGMLSDEAIQESVDAISRMHSIARGYEAASIRGIATSATREANNGKVLVDLVKNRTGLKLDVIDAKEEARLAHKECLPLIRSARSASGDRRYWRREHGDGPECRWGGRPALPAQNRCGKTHRSNETIRV